MPSNRMISNAARPVAALALLLALAGCESTTQSEPGAAPATTLWGQIMRGTVQEPKEVAPEVYAPVVTCPRVTVRAGTETHLMLKGKFATPDAVGFQATIAETARECTITGDTLAIRVGVAGRFLAGRKGGAMSGSLPLRIVVVKDGDKPVYSKLHQIPVAITPPATSSEWAFVDDQVSVPNEGVLQIYVGFDDGGKAAAQAAAAAGVPPP